MSKILLLLMCGILWVMALAVTACSESGGRPGAAASEAPQTPDQRLMRRVEQICAVAPPRDAAHPENLDKVARYITSAFEEAGLTATDQPYDVWGNTYRNVSVLMGPADAPRLVVGAHYDTNGEHATPGADDNASGVAVLIELAHRLAERPAHGEVAIELVAYTLEESAGLYNPGMGSMQHAGALKKQGVPVIGMICLEMLGYYSDEPGSQTFPIEALAERYPDTGNFIAIVGRIADQPFIDRVEAAMKSGAADPAVYSLAAPTFLRDIARSDHSSYWRHGYTAVMLTDTANLRNPHYHQPTDTPDTLDYDRMAGVLDQVEAAVRELASNPSP